jgi:hypothetical protein
MPTFVFTELQTLIIHNIIFQLWLSSVALLEEVKDAVFWDVTPCGSCKNWRFGGT